MSNAVRYSLLRILLFIGALLALWLAGLRNPLVLILVAATISMVISLFALSRMREAMSVEVAGRVEQRRHRGHKRRHQDVLSDEEAEELEASQGAHFTDSEESDPHR